MEEGNFKQILCVDYPGIVHNVDEMLDTVGGLSNLQKTFNLKNGRLELKFRPDDIYSHATFGDRVPVNNFFIKVIKKKFTNSDGAIQFKYETVIEGVIDSCYRFQSLAAFQYHPIDSSTNTHILKDILPTKPFLNDVTTFNSDAPLFILPTIFSRFDSPSDYAYRNEAVHRDKAMNEEIERQNELSIIGRTRKSRSSMACFLNWEDDLSIQPNAEFSNQPIDKELLDKLKQLFQQRPIWSRNSLMYHLSCTRADLKTILPQVAYYFNNGPFRCQWIRYGYNPKMDKSSKIYQTLDFRVKQTYAKSNNSNRILAKRSIYQYQLPLKKNDTDKSRNRYRASIIDHQSFLPSCSTSESQETQKETEKLYASFVFNPDMMPAHRQLFYQLCDIQVDEIQKLVHQNDFQEPDICEERDGWCVAGTIEKIRAIMSDCVDQMLAKDKTTLGQYRKDDCSSDEDT